MSEEKIKDINKEAYKQAEKELLDQQIKKVKGYILDTLNKLENKKKEKELIEEQIRVLKMDLDDLRNGRFDKIEERIGKSNVAKRISVNPSMLVSHTFTGNSTNGITWVDYTSGTYTLPNGQNYYF